MEMGEEGSKMHNFEGVLIFLWSKYLLMKFLTLPPWNVTLDDSRQGHGVSQTYIVL